MSGLATTLTDISPLLGRSEAISAETRAAISRGEYEQALGRLDSEMDASTTPELKLWWVRLHLELQDLPTSALSAPLEEVIQRTDSSLSEIERRLCAANFVMLGARLRGQAQFRLSVLMYERGLKLLETNELGTPHEISVIQQELIGALEDEITRASLRLEKKTYITELEEKRDKLKQRRQEVPPPPPPPTETPTAKVNILSSKAILGQLADPAPSAPQFEPKESIPAEATRERKSVQSIAAGVVIVAMMVVGVSLAVYRLIASGSDEQLAMQTTAVTVAQTELPELPPRIPVTEEGVTLDSVTERLNKLGERLSSAAASSAEQKAVEVPPEAPPSQLAQQSPEPVVPREEPAPIPEKPEKVDLAKVPQLDPDRLSQTKVDSLPPGGRASPAYGNDGRVYGPPPQPGGKTLDGQPVRAYEVQRYNPPQVFKTLVNTRVFDKPSELASEVSRLKRDAEVRVAARLGKWLELTSTGGKKGYIFAQDAVPQD